MLDLHVHVWPHGRGTPVPTLGQLEQYCEKAIAEGVTEIAITEHSHRFQRIMDSVGPEWVRPRVGGVADATERILEDESGADLDAYVDVLQRAQEAGLPLLIGLEVDYLPGAMGAMKAVLDDYPFDVLLGSVHWLDDWLFDAFEVPAFARRWHERDLDEVFSQYVDSVLDLAQSGVVDVLAHIDVIKVAGFVAPKLRDHEDRLVEGLVGTNMAIEFSSAGLRKPVESTYPSSQLLDKLLTIGLPFTTASDG